MKKVNDSTSASRDAKASSASKDLVSSDASVDATAMPTSNRGDRADAPTEETIKPKINKKSKSKHKLEGTAVKGKSKLSNHPVAEVTTTDATAVTANYGLADSQTVIGTSRYQPAGQSGDRIAIFIDGSNLFYAASHLNIEVDYRRLLTTLVGDRRLLRAYFYTGVDPQNEKQRGFLLWLNRHGHRVVSKELTSMPDGSRKANMHVEMAVDMMRIAEHCPTITLLGGDGNLAYALEALSRQGVSLEVVSLQSMTSDSLIDIADSYVDLADLRDEIKR